MKKILSLFLTLAVVLCALPFGAVTANAETSGYYTYTVSNGEAKITDCNTSISGDVKIPSELDGFPVTAIGDCAFENCDKITSVTISAGITSIGLCAFLNCISLSLISIPDNVTYIDANAFENCSSLKSITIPDSVTYIGPSAFYNTGYYNELSNWENDVLYIGNHLIKAKTSISNAYTIKSGTKTITDSAFTNCKSLTQIIIPDSVLYIGDSAFENCNSLNQVNIPDSALSIGSSAFYNCKYLKSIAIPDSVLSIGRAAFYNCTSLKAITISDKTTTICGAAFYNTGYFNDLNNWENGVLYIGKHLIHAKETLSGDYSIKSGTKNVAQSAFDDCNSLTSLTIPDDVTSLSFSSFYWETSAFDGCESLTSINVSEGNTVYSSLDGVLFNKNKTELLYYPKGRKDTSYSIPNSVASIGVSAFYNCAYLTSIKIPITVAKISDYAFHYCLSLTSVDINYGVTSIGKGAFMYCYLLESVTLPNSVTDIGEKAFYNCTSLKSVRIPEDVTGINENTFFQCFSLTSITFPGNIKSIGEKAFYNCPENAEVYYEGSKEDWQKICIDENDEYLLKANFNFKGAQYPIGDLDGDGKITQKDVDTIHYALFFPIDETNEENIKKYDLNNDRAINIIDCAFVKKLYQKALDAKSDINSDEKLDSHDVALIKKAVLDVNKLTDTEIEAYDLNGDGKHNILDLIRIKKLLANV